MTINLGVPEKTKKLRPRVLVLGVGGGGCNALNTMIESKLKGVEFVACNTDAQALDRCTATHKIQLGIVQTQGLGAGSDPAIGKAAAEESYNEICEHIDGAHMAFIAAGMGGGTGTGSVSTIAKACKEKGLLTIAVVTKPFSFEGDLRMQKAEKGIEELREYVDTLIVIPNQNLFIKSDEKTTYAEALSMVDHVLYAGVRGITDLMMQPGLINLDFADVKSVMSEMGRAVLGNGEAAGEKRAIEAAEDAISNPLLDQVSMQGAKGLLMNISGGPDMSLMEVDEAANRIKDEVDPSAKIIYGSSINKELDGKMRVSIVATGIENLRLVKKDDDKKNKEDGELFEKKISTDKIIEETTNKIAEQTDLEDFTNPVLEVKRDEEFNHKNDKIFRKINEVQEKPSNLLSNFIKKFSKFKIFGNDEEVNEKDTKEETKEKPTISVVKRPETEPNIEEGTQKEIKKEIKSEKKEEEREEKNVEVQKKEDVKEKIENNTIQVQSQIPGIDNNDQMEKNNEDDNNTLKDDGDDINNKEEDLEIPSFLRNQSN